jgi:hypothetical protein
MILSQIVAYKNLLDSFKLEEIHHEARHRLDGVIHKIINYDLQFNEYTNEVIEQGHAIDRSFFSFADSIKKIDVLLSKLILERSPEYYQRSTKVYQEEMCFEPNEYILNRHLTIDPVSAELLEGLIGRYADWKWPGVIFRPGREEFIDRLVALDPLYLVDHNLDLLEPAVTKFHPQYQRRLRTYSVDEKSEAMLSDLPNNQFGYCFAYNYFNYKPIEIIQRYITTIWHKLRPGGVLFMTFNDCDYAHGVALAEKNFMMYTPGSKLVEHAEAQGFEIVSRYRGEADLSWLELRKSGKLKSIRAGQTLAKIIPF